MNKALAGEVNLDFCWDAAEAGTDDVPAEI